MDVVYATTTTVVTLGGAQHRVQKGTHWPADDPIVAAQPSIFSTDPRYGLAFTREPAGYGDPVEQATAAPGERRAMRRPSR
ncbi:MAG TPA: hypothetical protein VIQ30_26800 [Pseudonocardia sp.]